MKRYLMIAVLALMMSSVATAGSFGVVPGKPVRTYAGKPGKVDGVYTIVVPQPNSEFESYSAVATPEIGICKVWGIGKDHDNDRYGADVREAYDRLKALLNDKYGASQEYSYIKSGALWDKPEDWVMSVKENERTLVSYWLMPDKQAVEGIKSISLEVKAFSSGSAYLDLTYEFENFPLCKKRFNATEASGL